LLKKMKLYAGSSVGSEPLELNLTSMTVFVGPNNSGKSQALREIESWLRSPKPPKGVVVQNLEFEPWLDDEIDNLIRLMEVEPRLNKSLQPDHIMIEKLNPQTNSSTRFQIHKPGLLNEAKNPNASRQRYTQLASLYTLKLDGTNRLALTNEQNAGDLLGSPANLLAHLCVNKEAREKLRKLVFESFGKYLVIDPTNIGKLRFRVSMKEPSTESEELGWDSTAQAFHKQATLITESSDGVKAFVGIVSSIVGGDPKVTLLDEPEAFLHPALSAKLGQSITSELAGSKKRIFVSTHSASFLMGCFQAGASINIIRLTYNSVFHINLLRIKTLQHD
jgi:ABC-type cobalamin/Fe3+-siderophores transport system ATPase subunit